MSSHFPPLLHVDWYRASPDEIKAEIARTRQHMDEHLAQLGRKIRPSANLRRLQFPVAALFVAVSGITAFRMLRRKTAKRTFSGRFRSRFEPDVKVKRMKVKSAGVFDQLRALRLAVAVIRKGKPAIFIVEPRKL